MFNPFSTFSIIAAPVETETLDDTQPFSPIRDEYQVVPLSEFFPYLMSDLMGKRLSYAQFDTSRELFTGKVVGFSATQLQIQPDDVAGYSLLTRWRSIDDVAGILVEVD